MLSSRRCVSTSSGPAEIIPIRPQRIMNVNEINENGSIADGGGGAQDRMVEDDGNEVESDEDEKNEGDHIADPEEATPPRI